MGAIDSRMKEVKEKMDVKDARKTDYLDDQYIARCSNTFFQEPFLGVDGKTSKFLERTELRNDPKVNPQKMPVHEWKMPLFIIAGGGEIMLPVMQDFLKKAQAGYIFAKASEVLSKLDGKMTEIMNSSNEVETIGQSALL